jgi:phosphoenolpyruvate carboxykinase (GTP)
MYAVPYALGPGALSDWGVGVQLTDSPHLVLLMQRLFRTGGDLRQRCRSSHGFVRSVHSMLALPARQAMACGFVESRTIWSAGVDPDALLALRCHALRLASIDGYHAGWVASPTSVLAVTPPWGEKVYLGAVRRRRRADTVRRVDRASRMESRHGFRWRRVAPGRSRRTLAGATCRARRGGVAVRPLGANLSPLFAAARYSGLFINAALTDDHRPSWDALGTAGERLVIGWNGERWDAAGGSCATQPGARVAFSVADLPHHEQVTGDAGVALDGIVFGVRRSDALPLVLEATDWERGSYLGATFAFEPREPGAAAPA